MKPVTFIIPSHIDGIWKTVCKEVTSEIFYIEPTWSEWHFKMRSAFDDTRKITKELWKNKKEEKV